MSFCIQRSALALLLVCASAAAQAQPVPTAVRFSQALDAAFALAAPAKAAQAQQGDWAARAAASRLRFLNSPELSLGHTSDGLVGAGGKRVWELGVSAALSPANLQSAQQQQIGAEERHWQLEQAALKHRLQGELLELLAQAELARWEAKATEAKVAHWQALAAEVDRRVNAGDAPRLDAIVLEAAVLQAQGASQQAQAAVAALLSAWRSKTGLGVWVPLPALPRALPPALAQLGLDHPEAQAAAAALALAQARVGLAQAERKEPMRYSAGLARERDAFGATAATVWRVGVSIPLQLDVRSAPKASAAQRDEAAAEIAHQTTLRGLRQQAEQAGLALEAAQTLAKALGEVASAQDAANALVQRAYRLGERDLQARIKSDGERLDAAFAVQKQAAVVTNLELKRLHALGMVF